jgi:DNA-directed RNA polymerase specialized sigma24 family protein
MASPELQKFLETLRSNDPCAIDDLLRQLDPYLRKIIRLRLIDGRLRRVVDTTDVFDSLLKDFLAQKEKDGPPVETSAGLHAYLAAAVHHKIQTRARKERRHAGSLPPGWEPVSPEAPPARQIEDHDFTETIRARLAEDTRLLFNLKTQGLSWTEIAQKVGGTPDALRMRLNRAVVQILRELGWEDASYDGRG